MSQQERKNKKFEYNLDSVLRVRNIRKKQEEEQFNKAQLRLREEKRKEEELKDFQKQKYNELREMMEAGSTIENFQHVLLRKSHLELLKEKVDGQEKIREEAEEKRDDQRVKLVAAVKNEKIIEKDKENKKEVWKKVLAKEQTKSLDDIATIGYIRRKREVIEDKGAAAE